MFIDNITSIDAVINNKPVLITTSNGKAVKFDASKPLTTDRCQDLLQKVRDLLDNQDISKIILRHTAEVWDMSEDEFKQYDRMDLYDSGSRPLSHTSKTYLFDSLTNTVVEI